MNSKKFSYLRFIQRPHFRWIPHLTLQLVFLSASLIAFSANAGKPKAVQKNTKVMGSQKNLKDLLSQVEKNSKLPQEQAEIEMRILKSGETSKVRKFEITRQTRGDSRIKIRMLSPADIEGLGYLSIFTGAEQNQWLYLPSSQQVRRISGTEKTGRILDSDLSFEDLNMQNYAGMKSSIVERIKVKGGEIAIIESRRPKSDKNETLKVRTWVRIPEYRIEKIEHLGRNDKPLRTLTLSAYQRIENKAWRAGRLEVKNLRTGGKTQLVIRNIKTRGIASADLTPQNLSDGF